MTRRREGSIQQRSKNSFLLRFSVRREDGTRRSFHQTVYAASRSAARKILTAKINERDTGVLVAPNTITLVELIAETITKRQGEGGSAKWAAHCRDLLRLHIEPHFGSKRLQQITPRDIDQFETALCEKRQKRRPDQPLAPATVLQIAKLVRHVLKRAAGLELIPRNPALRVRTPKTQKKEVAIVPPSDFYSLLDRHAADRRPSMARLAPLAHCAGLTGARLAELLAMRWCDLDLAARVWRVERSWEQVGRELKIRACKNEASRRLLEFGPDLAAALQAYKTAQAARLLAQGRRVNATDIVFDNGKGKAVRPNTASANWAKAMNRLGYTSPRIKFHSLRHLYASVALATGGKNSLLPLQRHLGHSKASTTMDIYGHLLPSGEAGMVAAVEAVLGRGPRQRG
jgi:integrase